MFVPRGTFSIQPDLTFPEIWRGGASSMSTTIFSCYPEMCDQEAGRGHSLFSAIVQEFF
jgi:hypothetical protein